MEFGDTKKTIAGLLGLLGVGVTLVIYGIVVPFIGGTADTIITIDNTSSWYGISDSAATQWQTFIGLFGGVVSLASIALIAAMFIGNKDSSM